ncbi:MAG: transposase domain-containing protein [Pseudomonadota bacterium]
MIQEPMHKVWWTADEIAVAQLPDLPGTPFGIKKLARRQHWNRHPGGTRRRKGRGGGLEYHFMLFPQRARDFLAAQAGTAQVTEAERAACEDWSAYEALPEKTKAKARERAGIIQAAFEMRRGGTTLSQAAAQLSDLQQVSARSIWTWIKKVEHLPEDQWLPALAGKHRAARRTIKTADCTPDAWEAFKFDYLRLEAPPLTDCYRRTARIAVQQGWDWPSEQTVRRMVSSWIPKTVCILAREGLIGLSRLTPPQIRDKSMLHAMTAVDADFHKFDVFVKWDDDTIIRPQMSVFHDIYSGKILAWRMAVTPNSGTVLLTLGDLLDDYGIPQHVVIDNGREYAAKWITGGVPNRFRFKIRDDDPLGVLPQMGIKVHFTQPYSGQSKPVERAFRDHCSSIAKDTRFAGAYVGNRPDAKPENYGSRAIDRDEFMRVVAEGIAEFNARRGRRSVIANGRSFDETFATSYANARVPQIQPEQRRLWLLGAEGLHAHRSHGELSFQGNKYWSDWCVDIAGQKVTARFDPDDLHAGLHVYAQDGRYLGHVECKEPVGFFDIEGGKALSRERARTRRLTRELLKAQKSMDRAEHVALLNAAAPKAPDPSDIERKVIEGGFKRRKPEDLMQAPSAQVEQRQLTPEERAQQAAIVHRLHEAPAPEENKPETARERYRRARDLIARINAGEPLGETESAWLASYQTTPEFASNQRLYDVWGEGMFA